MARSFFLTSCQEDGVGVAILPQRMTLTGQLAYVFSVPFDSSITASDVEEAISTVKGAVSHVRTGPQGNLVFAEAGVLDSNAVIARLGLSAVVMARPDNIISEIDPDCASRLRGRWKQALSDVGMSETKVLPELVGLNRYGWQVWNTMSGRVAKVQDDAGTVHGEFQVRSDGTLKGQSAPAFLRAFNREELAACARGVALMVAKGSSLNGRYVGRLHKAIVNDPDNAGMSVFDFQEEIEAQLASFAKSVVERGGDPREIGRVFTQRQAAHKERTAERMMLQQYSTPLSIAGIAADVLGDMVGTSVLEPSVGNGLLASLVAARGASITGIELDEKRLNRCKAVLGNEHFHGIHGDALEVLGQLEQKFDAVIANPPFDGMDDRIETDEFGRPVRIGSVEHDFVFQSLQLMKDDGRAFLVLPGSMIKKGAIEGGVRHFDNWLSSTYKVAGKAVLDGRLYAKAGARFPVIVYAIAGRMDVPTPVPTKNDERDLPFISTMEELGAWADGAKSEMIVLRGVVDGPVLAVVQDDAAEPVSSNNNIELGSPSIVKDVTADALSKLVDDLSVEADEFQLSYEPVSVLGLPSTKIQKALAGPTAKALMGVEDRRGPIDDFVGKRLGMSRAVLSAALSPEQIDATGLAFDAFERKRGILIADLMGVGKGRSLSALMYDALRNNRPVMFFTMKPELFQDILARDFCDVSGKSPDELPEIIKPFIVNNVREATVLHGEDGSQEVLFKHDGVMAKHCKEGGRLPSDLNMVLSTYSQFSSGGYRWKTKAIADWIDSHENPPLLVLDESHKAAGEVSRTGLLITDLVNQVTARGGNVAYASGTPLKSARNIKVYAPILPEVGLPHDALIELIEREPMALQEALSYEMVRGGTMISRDMDQSAVVREFPSLADIDPVKMERIFGGLNEFSSYLSELMEMSGEVSHWGASRRARMREEARDAGVPEKRLSMVQVSLISPAGRFHMISNYLMFGLNAQFARDLVAETIARGFKPLIAVDSTGDSIVEYRLNQAKGQLGRERNFASMPNMGDILKRTADRMLDATLTSGFGIVEKVRLTQFEDWLEDFVERVDASDFSMFPTSGIDVMRQELQEAGYSVGEMTGRKYELEQLDDGTYQVNNREKQRPQDVKNAFNRGDVDVVILNRTASSGISLHASSRNGEDLRPRKMIKLQLQPEITDERQIDGRIHRTGQIFAGHYLVPMAGLAAQDRLCQMFNRKNRSLTSASSASRENASNINDVTDLLNPVGELVVQEFLQSNPEIAARLAIDPNNVFEAGFARKMMGRLIVLPTEMQSIVMAELDTNFQMMVAVLDAKGENPLRLRQHDWGARVSVMKTLVPGDPDSDVTAFKPLTLNKVSYSEQVNPKRVDDVLLRIKRSEEDLLENGQVLQMSERFPDFASHIRGALPPFHCEAFDRVLTRSPDLKSMGGEETSLSDAEAIWENQRNVERDKAKGLEKSLIEAANRFEFLAGIVPMLRPGNIVYMNADVFRDVRASTLSEWMNEFGRPNDGRTVPVVITGVRCNEERLLNLGEWDMRFMIPGESRESSVTLAGAYQLLREDRIKREEQGDEYIPDRDLRWAFAYDAYTKPLKAFVAGDIRNFGAKHAEQLELLTASMNINVQQENECDYGYDFRDEGSSDAQVMRSLFDCAVGGLVKRKRMTLEGNLFEAVRLGSAQRIGEKSIYTTAGGDIRHAILLRQDSMKKLMAKVDFAMTERSAFRSVDQSHLESLLSVHSMMAVPKADVNVQRFAKHAAAMAVGPKGGDHYREAVGLCIASNFDAVHAALISGMIEARGTSAIFAGGDPFGGLKMHATLVRGNTDCEQVVTMANPETFPSVVREMDNDGFAFFADSHRQFLVLAGVKNPVVEMYGKDWRKNFMGFNLPGKFVGSTLKDHEQVSVLLEVADLNEGQLAFRGGFLGLIETAETVVRDFKIDPNVEPVHPGVGRQLMAGV